MPRRFFRRISADFHGKQPGRPWYLRAMDQHPAYLAVTRRSIAGAMGTGLAIGMLPLPGHMALAMAAALLLRVNVAVAALVVWVSNPLTMGPLLYAEYRLGSWLLGESPGAWPAEFNWDALVTGLAGIWKPLLAGGGILAAVAGLLGYLATDRFWRWSVARRQRDRLARRRP
jgi:uncharacterized protein (DUF2062 family)